MKNIRLLPTMLLCFLAFQACKKEVDIDKPDVVDLVNIPKIKTYTYLTLEGNYTTQTYTYDSLGRISTMLLEDSTGPHNYQYIHTDTAIIVVADGIPNSVTLNSNGYINDFTYNADGHRITSTSGVTFTWQNGDLTKMASTDATAYFTYTDTISTISAYNFGIAYAGKDIKHLVDYVIYYNALNIPNNTENYEYIFDSEGRVIKETTLDRTYTYY